MNEEALARFWYWMNERHKIYRRKRMGLPKPWTEDAILRDYRFCNVFRELDTVTQWIRSNWSRPNDDHEWLWLAMTIARFVNWPDTLDELGYPSEGWTDSYEKHFVDTLEDRRARGLQVYTGAYMVRGDIQGGYAKKSEYLAYKVIRPMVEQRSDIVESFAHNSLEHTHRILCDFYGVAGFMGYEIVTDLRHTSFLRRAYDVFTWANAGPGAVRGLNRLHDRKLSGSIPQAQAVEEMRTILDRWPEAHAPMIKCDPAIEVEMRDIEHSLCEFDKYERVRLGEGRPRSKYPGL